MSIASEITRLQNAKAALKSAIESKDVTVPSSTKLDGYASLVSSISGIVPTGTINITQNGTVDVTQYASASVNVQQPLSIKSVSIDLIKYAPVTRIEARPTSLGTNPGDLNYKFVVEFNQPVDETIVSAEDFTYYNGGPRSQVEALNFDTPTSVSFTISNLRLGYNEEGDPYTGNLYYKNNIIHTLRVNTPSILAWHWNDSSSGVKDLYFESDSSVSYSRPGAGNATPKCVLMLDFKGFDSYLFNKDTLKWKLEVVVGGTSTYYYCDFNTRLKEANRWYVDYRAFEVTPQAGNILYLEFNGIPLMSWIYR